MRKVFNFWLYCNILIIKMNIYFLHSYRLWWPSFDSINHTTREAFSIIINKVMFSKSSICRVDDELSWYPISNTECMKSELSIVISDEINNLVFIGNLSIGNQVNLFFMKLIFILIDVEQWLVDFCSSHVCIEFFNFW